MLGAPSILREGTSRIINNNVEFEKAAPFSFDIENEKLSVVPVSYTHLDVYKRQSYSHCVMLMNPKVEEMAVAKYNDYWVQHFGKRMKR